jgi:leucyl-tRNA synthetase
VGGAEHAVLHLLYARFWHKVLYDLKLVHTAEPFQRLLNPGMILGYSYRHYDDDTTDDRGAEVHSYSYREVEESDGGARHRATGRELKARWTRSEDVRWVDGRPLHPEIDGLELEQVTEKMSKSRGNVVNPDEVIARWGTDALRLYEMFMGPLDKGAPWSDESIPGLHRFLQRVHRMVAGDGNGDEAPSPLCEGKGSEAQARLTAHTIRGVTEDIEAMRFNTAISKLMVFVRDVGSPVPQSAARSFALLLAPFAPHLAEELWQRLGGAASLAHGPWPEADPSLLVAETVTLAVQVNGKRRAEITVPADADEEAIRSAALGCEPVQRHLAGRTPRKLIVVPGRLVNVVG